MAAPTVTVPADKLRDYITRIFAAAGCAPDEAARTTHHLLSANLAGHDSHGVGMLPTYVRLLHAGLLVPNQTAETVLDAGALLVQLTGKTSDQFHVQRVLEGLKRDGFFTEVKLSSVTNVGRGQQVQFMVTFTYRPAAPVPAVQATRATSRPAARPEPARG